ncbi:MAG: tRNA threonylcarbamoyladenosine biosynthesis protein TsaB [Chlamydiae bacterium]|nr:tRNA threonylcarbamoyladenosine biosynthesis protein TsaB [Chlamydiota bacterium]
MKVLILDSSTPLPFVAILEDNTITFYKELKPQEQSSKHLLPLIEKEHLKTLGAIAIGRGPGSYTGIRIALSIAKALSFALNIPLIPFDAMKAIDTKKKGRFLIVLDARVAGFYGALCDNTNGLVNLTDPKVYTKEELLDESVDFFVSLEPEKLKEKLPTEQGFFDKEHFKNLLSHAPIKASDPFPLRYLGKVPVAFKADIM